LVGKLDEVSARRNPEVNVAKPFDPLLPLNEFRVVRGINNRLDLVDENLQDVH
jgi:hypothetical protein